MLIKIIGFLVLPYFIKPTTQCRTVKSAELRFNKSNRTELDQRFNKFFNTLHQEFDLNRYCGRFTIDHFKEYIEIFAPALDILCEDTQSWLLTLVRHQYPENQYPQISSQLAQYIEQVRLTEEQGLAKFFFKINPLEAIVAVEGKTPEPLGDLPVRIDSRAKFRFLYSLPPLKSSFSSKQSEKANTLLDHLGEFPALCEEALQETLPIKRIFSILGMTEKIKGRLNTVLGRFNNTEAGSSTDTRQHSVSTTPPEVALEQTVFPAPPVLRPVIKSRHSKKKPVQQDLTTLERAQEDSRPEWETAEVQLSEQEDLTVSDLEVDWVKWYTAQAGLASWYAEQAAQISIWYAEQAAQISIWYAEQAVEMSRWYAQQAAQISRWYAEQACLASWYAQQYGNHRMSNKDNEKGSDR